MLDAFIKAANEIGLWCSANTTNLAVAAFSVVGVALPFAYVLCPKFSNWVIKTFTPKRPEQKGQPRDSSPKADP